MAISPFGLQPVEESGIFYILWKATRERAWQLGGATFASVTNTIADDSGNGRPVTANESLHVTNGPSGKAGWDDADPADLLFARRFGLNDGITAGVIDAAVPLACSAEHTFQVCFKCEWDDFSGSARGIHGTGVSFPTSGIGNDFINRLDVRANAVGSGGRLALFTENNDVDSQVFTADDSVRPGFWQIFTAIHRIQDGTFFDTTLMVHTLEANGTVTGGIDSVQTTRRCNVASGTTSSQLLYGEFETTSPSAERFVGDIALGRVVESALSDLDAIAEAQEFLTTGTLADYTSGGSTELYSHRFNEAPELVDEGPLGVHVSGQGDVYCDADAVGTGGTCIRPTAANRTVARQFTAPVSLGNIIGATRPRLVDLFNDSVASIPEWNLLLWASPQGASSTRFVYFESVSGESLATNTLQMFFDNVTNGNIGFFAERGSGTNISGKTQTGGFPVDPIEDNPVRLWGVRYKEDPGAAGDPLLRGSIDDTIDVLTRGINDQFQGGINHAGWELDWSTVGLIQEALFVWGRELTDLEIQNAFANRGTGGGSGGGDDPTIEIVSPAPGSNLAPDGTVTVRVLDDVGVGFAELSVRYAGGASEIIARDDSFRSPYAGTRTPISGGFEYAVTRTGGWPQGTPLFEAIVIDDGGNRS